MSNYVGTRRKVQFLILTLLAIVAMAVVLSAQLREKVKMPTFSAESGFYDDAFYLEITVPEGCKVYYTLDSTTPDQSAKLYTEPIYISNASLNENTYSMIDNMTLENWGAKEPDFLIDKCTVVRAVAIMESSREYRSSEIVTKSYFVGFPEDYFGDCGIISLVTDPENLFDSKKGIYVTGDILEEYMSSAEDPYDISWAYWPANYTQRGREWERQAHITCWNPEGTLCLAKEIGIRVQGGWSRAYVPRSLNLYAREEYDGEPYFAYDFFDNSLQLASLTLTAGGSGGYITQLNDYLIYERVKDLSFDVKTHRPYVLFLDGEYWGFYWLTEKCDATYLREKYDLENSEVVIIKAGELEEGSDEDLISYQKMLQFFVDNDMSIDKNYQRACNMIDMENFIDYYATMIYIARSYDWPITNETKWRTKTVSNKPYADGRWRWHMFDCNAFCMSENLIADNTLQTVNYEDFQMDEQEIAKIEEHFPYEWAVQETAIFRSCWKNESFKADFEKRILEIADQCFDASQIDEFLTNYSDTMVPILSKSWARFWGSSNNRIDTFVSEVDSVRTFFIHRRAVVESWFED